MDGQIWRSMCQQMLQLEAPASMHQPPRSPPLSPPLNAPADSPQHQLTPVQDGFPQLQESILIKDQEACLSKQTDAVQEVRTVIIHVLCMRDLQSY